MKLYLPLIASVLVLASCSTSYQTTQTPDDVYYSPERQRDEYVRVKEKDDRQYNDQLTEEQLREDRYLRMKTSYRRYSTLDDYDCYCYTGVGYNRYYDYYRYNSAAYYNPTFNWYNRNYNVYSSYYYNPYYNKPYYSGYVVGNVTPVYNKPRKGNLSVYDKNRSNHTLPVNEGKRYSNSSSREDNYRGSGTNAGTVLRNVFGGSTNNSSSSSSSSNNSSSTSSGSSSSSSSGATKSAPARKF